MRVLRSRVRLIWAGILFVVLVATACSGPPDEDAAGASTTSIAATTSTTDAPAPPDPSGPPVSAATTTPDTTDVAADPTVPPPVSPEDLVIERFAVPPGSRPHDVAPAADGGVWYTAQGAAALGWLDPDTGVTRHVALGDGSRPHGVIVDDSGDAWVTDGGLNAIVRVDGDTDAVTTFPLPADRGNVNLNTATFDLDGQLWFTGQAGVYGVFDPSTEQMEVFDAPRGGGPYGIDTSPAGDVFFASLAGSYIGAIRDGGEVEELDPPTPSQGARRVWFDSTNRAWVSEWNVGQLSVYDPDTGEWETYALPGAQPRAYAVYVDETDIVWVSDFGANAIHRFDPATETFTTFPLPDEPGDVRQILGRPGEVWGAESAADALVVIRQR